MASYSTEAIVRLPMVEEAKGPRLTTSGKVAEFCRDIEGLAQETFHLLTLNQKNAVIDRHMVALGSLTGTIVHPREVFRLALLDCAAGVMFVHNHPSGDPTPSEADRELTGRMVKAAKLLGIRVLDHVVMGRGGRHFSFYAEGILTEGDSEDEEEGVVWK